MRLVRVPVQRESRIGRPTGDTETAWVLINPASVAFIEPVRLYTEADGDILGSRLVVTGGSEWTVPLDPKELTRTLVG